MKRSFLVAEDTGERRRLFDALGVTWLATRYAWLSPLFWLALGLAMAFADPDAGGATDVLLAGVWYGIVLAVANALHSLGHIVVGRAVRAPVEAILLTSTRDVTIYREPGDAAPARRRLGRSLGGPAANLVAGCALVVLARRTHLSWLAMAGYINVGIALWTLAPVPSLDGWVIWGILARSSGRGRAGGRR
jgi:Zn-dependent protease